MSGDGLDSRRQPGWPLAAKTAPGGPGGGRAYQSDALRREGWSDALAEGRQYRTGEPRMASGDETPRHEGYRHGFSFLSVTTPVVPRRRATAPTNIGQARSLTRLVRRSAAPSSTSTSPSS